MSSNVMPFQNGHGRSIGIARPGPGVESPSTPGPDDPDPAAGQDFPPPAVLTATEVYLYDVDQPTELRFQALARRLRQFGDLFRNPEFQSGLVQVTPGAQPESLPIVEGIALRSVIVDRLRIAIVANGKPKSGFIPPADLASMLTSEVFLQAFRPLDGVITQPVYLSDWRVTVPGHNDGGPGQRVYLAGAAVTTYPEPTTIRQFLAAMVFATEADRTNAVAAALTVLLRNHWPGRKPVFLITANRSHAGKGTIAAFVAGQCPIDQVTYEPTDWAFARSIATAFQHRPDLAVLNLDNIRLDCKGAVVRSAFLERILHEPASLLQAPGTKRPVRVPAHYVVLATVNDGLFSTDLINRSVSIHLHATGDLLDRVSAIGDPKGEFLPQNRDRIVAELHGMIRYWIEAGCPLDDTVRHVSFPEWAAVIGGILKVNGFESFLANQTLRRSAEDPVRRGLAILGAAYPDGLDRVEEWVTRVAHLGLTEDVIPTVHRGSPHSRLTGLGRVLSDHVGMTLVHQTDGEDVTLGLRRERGRHDGKIAVRYRFEVLERRARPADDEG